MGAGVGLVGRKVVSYWIYFLARLPATQGSVGWGNSDFGCGNRTCSSQKPGVRRGTLLRAHAGKAKLTPQHDAQPAVGRCQPFVACRAARFSVLCLASLLCLTRPPAASSCVLEGECNSVCARGHLLKSLTSLLYFLEGEPIIEKVVSYWTYSIVSGWNDPQEFRVGHLDELLGCWDPQIRNPRRKSVRYTKVCVR